MIFDDDKREPTYSFGDGEIRKAINAQIREGGHHGDGNHDVFEHRGCLRRQPILIRLIETRPT